MSAHRGPDSADAPRVLRRAARAARIREMQAAGMTNLQMADALHISTQTLANFITRHGVTRAARPPAAEKRVARPRVSAEWIAARADDLIRMRRLGMSYPQIARALGLGVASVAVACRVLASGGTQVAVKPQRAPTPKPTPRPAAPKPTPILRPVQPIRTAPLDFRVARPPVVDDAATCDAALAARMEDARAMLRRGVEPGTVAMRAKVALRVAYQIAGEIRREARA